MNEGRTMSLVGVCSLNPELSDQILALPCKDCMRFRKVLIFSHSVVVHAPNPSTWEGLRQEDYWV